MPLAAGADSSGLTRCGRACSSLWRRARMPLATFPVRATCTPTATTATSKPAATGTRCGRTRIQTVDYCVEHVKVTHVYPTQTTARCARDTRELMTSNGAPGARPPASARRIIAWRLGTLVPSYTIPETDATGTELRA